MNWRIAAFVALGLAGTPVAYVGFVTLFGKLMLPDEWSLPGLTWGGGEPPENGRAPISLHNLGHLKGKGVVEIAFGFSRATTKVLLLDAIKGQAFVGDRLIPLDQLKSYINETKLHGVEFVIVTPSRGSVLKDVVPVIDVCRQSSVTAVLLNQTQSL